MARKGGNPDIAELGRKTRVQKGEKTRPSMGGKALAEKLKKAKTMAEEWAIIRALETKAHTPDGDEVKVGIGAAIVMKQAQSAMNGDIQAAKFVSTLEPQQTTPVSLDIKGLAFVLPSGCEGGWKEVIKE